MALLLSSTSHLSPAFQRLRACVITRACAKIVLLTASQIAAALSSMQQAVTRIDRDLQRHPSPQQKQRYALGDRAKVLEAVTFVNALFCAVFLICGRFQRAQKQLQKVYSSQLTAIRGTQRHKRDTTVESPPPLNSSVGSYRTRAPPAINVPRKARYVVSIV